MKEMAISTIKTNEQISDGLFEIIKAAKVCPHCGEEINKKSVIVTDKEIVLCFEGNRVCTIGGFRDDKY